MTQSLDVTDTARELDHPSTNQTTQTLTSTINTGGGTYIEGSVAIGGDLIGRDQIINIIYRNIEYPPEQLRELIDRVRSTEQPTTWNGKIPYVGLASFEEENAQWFFGRDRDINELLKRLENAHGRFVCITGASGSGKSSLMCSGLLHALKMGKCTGSTAWRYAQLRPSTDPVYQVAIALDDVRAGAGEQIRAEGLTNPNILHDMGKQLLRGGDQQRLMLFVDQFEELFTQTSDDAQRKAFLNLLTTAVQTPGGRVAVVIALRTDFLDHCTKYPALLQLINQNQYTIGEMQPAELAQTVFEPALAVGVRIEPELVKQVVSDMEEAPGALPLMQFALLDLFKSTTEEQRAGALITLTRADYTKRGGLQKALERHANQAFDRLQNAEEQKIGEHIFANLIKITNGKTATRRDATDAELTPVGADRHQVKHVLEELVSARLLIVNVRHQDEPRTTTIAHEKLFEAWPWLHELVQEQSKRLILQNELNDDARTWESHECHPSYLYTGKRLQAIQAELQKHTFELNDLTQKFIVTSRARQQYEQWSWHLLWGGSGVVLLIALVFGWRAWQSAAVAAQIQMETDRTTALNLVITGAERLPTAPVIAITTTLGALPSAAAPKPYVPEAEFTLIRVLRTSLERQYRAVPGFPLTLNTATQGPAMIASVPEQVAFGADWHAVAGEHLYLVAPDLSTIITPTALAESVQAILWSSDGKTLLGRTAHRVGIWQDEKLVIDHPFSLTKSVGCAEWRPDNPQVAICIENTLRLWSYTDNTVEKVYDFPTDIRAIRWSPDGTRLAAWDQTNLRSDQTFLIWDTERSQPMITATVPYTDRIFKAAAWSPDSQLLVAAALRTDGSRLWAIKDGEVTAQPLTGAQIGNVEFVAPDRFITWGNNEATRIWSTDGQFQIQFAPELVQRLLIAPDGTSALALLQGGGAYLWYTTAEEHPAMLFCCHESNILAAAWRDDGAYLATGGGDGTVRIWQIATGQELITLYGHGDNGRGLEVYGVRWQNKDQLLSYGADGTFRVWQVIDSQDQPLCTGADLAGNALCYPFSTAFFGFATAVTQADWVDNHEVVTVDGNGVAQRISLTANKVLTPTGTGPQQPIAAWSTDGQHVLALNADRTAEIINADTGVVTPTNTGPITAAFALDMGFLLNQDNGEIVLIEPESGQANVTLQGHISRVTAVQLSPDGQRLAAAEENGVIHLWDLKTGEAQNPLVPTPRIIERLPIHELIWSGDGSRLLAASGRLVLWEITKEEPLLVIEDTGHKIHADLSNDGHLVAVTVSREFFVIGVESGQVRWHEQRHHQPILGIRWVEGAPWPHQERVTGFRLSQWWPRVQPWSPSTPRQLLLTWSGDGTVRLWDWESQTEIARIAEAGPLTAAAVSPDGSHIFTAALDDRGQKVSVRIWQSWHKNPEALVKTAADLVGYRFSGLQTPLLQIQTFAP